MYNLGINYHSWCVACASWPFGERMKVIIHVGAWIIWMRTYVTLIGYKCMTTCPTDKLIHYTEYECIPCFWSKLMYPVFIWIISMPKYCVSNNCTWVNEELSGIRKLDIGRAHVSKDVSCYILVRTCSNVPLEMLPAHPSSIVLNC